FATVIGALPDRHSVPTRRSSDLLTELDMETVDSELSSLQAACEDEGLPTEKADTSPTGRVSFACNLIADVNDADGSPREWFDARSEEHTSELQSRFDLVCRLLLA